MGNRVHTFGKAAELPGLWNEHADLPFLTKEVLTVLEQVNPCGQRYHLTGDSIFVTYRIRLNILTYGFSSLKLPATVLGLPFSVSSPGHSGGLSPLMMAHMKGLSGLKLILNTPEERITQGFSGGRTLPSALFHIRWNRFEDYLGSLRSAYRYRLRKARARGESLTSRYIKPDEFDPPLHALYLNVYRNSDYKLERLEPAYFKRFPAEIIRFDNNGKAAGFVQLHGHGGTLHFMFGGMDYTLVREKDLYLNMLMEIIRHGIENGYQFIELGQTATEIKQKLGALPVEKRMCFSHTNPLINRAGKLFRPLLTYGGETRHYRVFRKAA